MPRRLDPRKGLPGLFSPGRPKAEDMAFLVESPRAPAAAVETPPRALSRRPAKKKRPAPAPAASPAPVPDYIRDAPAFRTVPVLPDAPEPFRLPELPSLVSGALGFFASLLGRGLLRSGR
jgi:hypothetical protein